MSIKNDEFVFASSPGMHEMADNVAAIIKKKHGVEFTHHRLKVETFASGEFLVHAPHTVRRQHVFLFHPMQLPSPSEAFIKLIIANDMLMRASVEGITQVLPFMSYQRQDRKHKERVPISARATIDAIEQNPAVKKFITAEMHAEQIQGMFSVPADNLEGKKLFVEDARNTLMGDFCKAMSGAADFGAAVRTRRLAKYAGDIPVAIIEKSRPDANKSEILSITGEPVKGRFVIVYEDIIDTGGTIRNLVRALMEQGALGVLVYAMHGLFSAGAEKEFSDQKIKVVVTNSIPRSAKYYAENESWLRVISIDDMLAEAIYQSTLRGGSISNINK